MGDGQRKRYSANNQTNAGSPLLTRPSRRGPVTNGLVNAYEVLKDSGDPAARDLPNLASQVALN
jgi:hypothetical protein